MSANQNVVIVQQSQPQAFGFVALMIVCGIVALIIKYFWFILFAALILGGLLMYYRSTLEPRRLAATAELQNKQYLVGDPRGTFGEDTNPA